eukprot:scaffold16958_cov128-Skeletonema_menzelii.AAC.1
MRLGERQQTWSAIEVGQTIVAFLLTLFHSQIRKPSDTDPHMGWALIKTAAAVEMLLHTVILVFTFVGLAGLVHTMQKRIAEEAKNAPLLN